MKIRKVYKYRDPIACKPGDTIQGEIRLWNDATGELLKVIATPEEAIGRPMLLDRFITFDVEESDGFGGVGIGGVFLEQGSQEPEGVLPENFVLV